MMRIVDGIPYVTVTLTHQGQELTLDKVFVDTGSQGTAFALSAVLSIGLTPSPGDRSCYVYGVGGEEVVFLKRIDAITIETLRLENLEVELGDLDYGFEAEGIIGMDFLLQTHAVLDFANLTLTAAP